MTLLRVDGAVAAAAAETNSEGGFAFFDLELGSYRLFAERPGSFSRQAYGFHRNPSFGAVIGLTEGRCGKELAFPLLPDGSIAGRIFDEEGDLVNASVYALTYSYRRGFRQLEAVGMRGSGDPSTFEIGGLPPGKYLLVAVPPERSLLSQAAIGPVPAQSEKQYVASYYPGTLDLSSASAVQVEPGAATQVDLRLLRRETVRVRGRVIAPAGAGVSGLTLFPVTGGSNPIPGRNRTVALVGPEGEFEIPGLTPGSYVLSAGRPRTLLPIKVGPKHAEEVVMTLKPGTDLTGTVIPAGLPGIMVSLVCVDVPVPGAFEAAVGRSGAFSVKGLFPAKYWLDIGGIPEGMYLQSVRHGDDVVGDVLDLSTGVSGALTIVLGAPPARLDGVVLGGTEQPACGAIVSLIPAAGRSSQVKRALTDEKGAFRFSGVSPGDYMLIAWADLDPDADRDPEFVKPFLERALRLSLREGDARSVRLGLVSPYAPSRGIGAN